MAAADPAFHIQLWASSDRFHHTLAGCPVPLDLAREIAARPVADVRATKAKFVAAAGIAARGTLAL